MEFNISLYLDKRKSSRKINNLFPVKLRVYSTLIKKVRLYSTGIDMTTGDFNIIFKSSVKVRGKNKELKIFLSEIENKAEKVAQGLSPFLFDSFEKKMFRNKNASISVEHHYGNKIDALKKNNQIGTSSNYNLSLKSIEKFIEYSNRGKLKNLTLYEINKDWLEDYENYMISKLNRTRTTVSFYLRALRTIFNDAISLNDVKQEIYPFGKGKGKYQIPAASKQKKALTEQQLGLLFKAIPKTKKQELAKDIWFFSYACSGMNMKDIALLKYENFKNDTLTYHRAKTINTKKGNLKEIKIFLNDYAMGILEKYGDNNKSNKQLIFPIVKIEDDAVEQRKKIKNFTSTVNLHFNKLVKNVGIEFNVTTYWARHSFATNSIRKGASMEFISEALNHSNLSVTKNYFAGFEDETKKKFTNTLMDF